MLLLLEENAEQMRTFHKISYKLLYEDTLPLLLRDTKKVSAAYLEATYYIVNER